MKAFLHSTLIISMMPLFCSCAMLQLKRQVTELEQHGAIGVVISPVPSASVSTYALAWSSSPGGQLESVGLQKVSDLGIASFDLMTHRAYGVAAFTDENHNGRYEPGEPLAFQENVRPAQFTDVSTPLQVLQFQLMRTHPVVPRAVMEMPKENRAHGHAQRASLGEVVPLNDPRFSKRCGSDGMWRPSSFLNDNTLGIYFMEPYDPTRIPVLFVHGIGGSPQEFSYMMEHFDHTQYQLWFFHYPSGLRLNRLSAAMAKGLEVLQQRYHFTECHVVAHSMGGLVSAAGVREAGLVKGTNFVTKLITISTPFGGHEAAEWGVRRLDKPVPSWIDVAPRSEFLRELAFAPMPSGTRHDLIYGDKGRSDGVVTVASQLEPNHRGKAASVTAFPFRHDEILKQAVVVNRVLECLQN